MPQPIPYLAFDGSCADAMRYYASALGGTPWIVNGELLPLA
jgi:PhnB protein